MSQRRYASTRSTNTSSRNDAQKIIFPWHTQAWENIKDRILKTPINSIVDMDSRISSLSCGRIKPRQITTLFGLYFESPGAMSQQIFVGEIIPMLQQLVRDAPRVLRDPVYILGPDIITNVELSCLQCATIIACVWFELFDYNYIETSDGENKQRSRGRGRKEDSGSGGSTVTMKLMPYLTFQNIFEEGNNGGMFALSCLVNYFRRLHSDIPARSVIFKRNVILHQNWKDATMPICEVLLGSDFVDDSPSQMHCVYAHEYIGSVDMFKGSVTQESIILLTRPETIVAALLCAKLGPNETLTVIGAEKMSLHRGFGSSVTFVRDYIDDVEDSGVSTLPLACVFMDASQQTSGKGQLVNDFDRDLNKALCGITSVYSEDVACGNWTHGFNGVNMQLRFLQLLLATSRAEKKLMYYSFSTEFESRIEQFMAWVDGTGITTGELYMEYKHMMADILRNGKEVSKLADLDIFDTLING